MTIPRVSDVVGIINKITPFSLAEEWDNVGLQVGDPAAQAERIMVALDPGEGAIAAAIADGCALLVTHHPLIFAPLKKVVAAEAPGSLISRAIRHDLAVIALHTNYDSVTGGLNDLLAARLGLDQCAPLKAAAGEGLVKLVAFVPTGHEERVMEALFRFSGFIGNYRDCSFRTGGTGTFLPLEGAQPFIGTVGAREEVAETRLEVLLPKGDLGGAVKALLAAHPYEEPAFDLYPVLNQGKPTGLGRIGVLAAESTLGAFAALLKEQLGCRGLRMVGDPARKVRKVALCSGSGASLLREAVCQGADVLVTGDVKYHEARDAEARGIALVDAGHFATEVLMVTDMTARLSAELVTRGYQAEVKAYEGEREPFTYL